MPTANQAKLGPRKLILLADGGALADLNDRLTEDGTRPKDFTKVPAAIIQTFAAEKTPVDCPKESRIFCAVGSEKAQNFLAKMGEAWNVRPFALSFAKYERGGESAKEKHRFRIRFHAYLGYALGLFVGTYQQSPGGVIVGIVSDDPHLLPCIGDARAAGIDARLIWWQSSIGEEVQFFAARSNAPVLLLPTEDAPEPQTHRDSALLQAIRATLPAAK
jgi:hypothetical protein